MRPFLSLQPSGTAGGRAASEGVLATDGRWSMEDGPLAVGHQMTPHARSVKIKSPANNQTPPVSSSPVRVTVRERSLAEYGESGGGGHAA